MLYVAQQDQCAATNTHHAHAAHAAHRARVPADAKKVLRSAFARTAVATCIAFEIAMASGVLSLT